MSITKKKIQGWSSESGTDYQDFQFYGLHNDEKPTLGIGGGSEFFEIDTGDLYYFDEENTDWLLQPKQESGGEGGGGTAHSITCYSADQQNNITPIADCAYKGVWSEADNDFVADTETGVVTELLPGDVFVLQPSGNQYPSQIVVFSSIDVRNAVSYSKAQGVYNYTMPNADIVAIIILSDDNNDEPVM